MLKQRVITAVIIVCFVLGALLFFPPTWFQVFIAACIAVGAWEWSALSGLTSAAARGAYTAVCLVLMFAVLHVNAELRAALFYASALWWLVAFVLVINYPAGAAG